ncbi:hypothetical protein TWF718_003057 [Orbilia javanica]|uniref:EGF-like domain-containing protein n=1 Tax=Orbilia javanica TaxID=47235 RepID=A0AAN8RBS2_9PEZI
MQNFARRSYDQSKNTLDPLDEDPIYEDHSPRALRVVNGGIDPRHMRKGSYIEDDSYAVPLPSQEYGGLPEFPVYTKSGATPDVSRKRDSRDQSAGGRSSGRTGRSGARRSLILGPQPQPQLQSGSPQSASKPRFPVNPSASTEYYRQQQQQYQQVQNNSRSSRTLSQNVSSPGFGRYSPPLEADEDAEFDEMRARSIMIGFEAPSPSTTNQNTPNGSQFPPLQPQNLAPFHNVARGSRTSASSTNSAVAGKRGHAVSSHYSQVSYVSTIPEEASDYSRNAHNSYASSHVIPSSWGSPVGGLWIPASNEELMSDASSISKGSNKSRSNDYEDFDEGATLVRQASMGRKQKPKLTNVRARSTERSSDRSSERSSEKSSEKASEKSDLRSKSSKSDLTNNSHSHGKRGGSIASLKLEQKMTGKSEKVMMASQPISTQMEVSDDLQPPPKFGFWQRLSAISTRSNSSDMAPKPLRIPSGKNSPEDNYATMHSRKGSQSPSVGTGPLGANLSIPQPTLNRPRPPRLNIDAVREAEARGSLTSLPELIRRATKLAAVLETGARPDSRWEGSRAPSMMSTDTSNVHGHGHGHGRYQESLSDILASFPPPLASSRHVSSRGTAWPLPGDFAYLQSEETSEIRRKRKICGLPLWAFILLVLLAIVVATAAVILPVQLVALNKDKSKASSSSLDTCAKTNPCLNGGLVSVEDGKCTCVCTNEFFGANCGQSNDPACTTMLIQETTGSGPISRNVSVGLAIPRLLGVSDSKFKVPINSATLANTFSSQNTTCALQNALVMLNGRTSPPGTASDSQVNTVSTGIALDETVVDFARVAVLYLASTAGMRQAVDARENLGTIFADGNDYGTVKIDGTIEIDLTKLRISTGSGEKVVGGLVTKHKNKRAETMNHGHLVRRHKIPGGLV